MDGEMIAYEPQSLMEFRWGPDVVRFELRAKGKGGSILTLMDTLEERGKGARDGAGWHVCLDSMEAHLRGEPAARDAMGAWKDVHSRYVESFGPQASTIGPPESFDAEA